MWPTLPFSQVPDVGNSGGIIAIEASDDESFRMLPG